MKYSVSQPIVGVKNANTRPMYTHMDPPGRLIYVPPGPGLVEHNILYVVGHHITEKSPHDIMANINIVFHSFVT